jgi:hypothetical protein
MRASIGWMSDGSEPSVLSLTSFGRVFEGLVGLRLPAR